MTDRDHHLDPLPEKKGEGVYAKLFWTGSGNQKFTNPENDSLTV
jgi:hypothetical protein